MAHLLAVLIAVAAAGAQAAADWPQWRGPTRDGFIGVALPAQWPDVLPEYGTTASPLIDGTSVIVHLGGHDSGALTLFDASTGKPRWRWTGDGPGNGSPISATFGGVRQVIAQTQKFLVGLDASTGALLWHVPFTTDFDQNAFTPVVFQDLLINAGLDHPLAAIRLKRDGDTWVAETAWTNLQAPMFMSSPVLTGGTIYGLTYRGRGSSLR